MKCQMRESRMKKKLKELINNVEEKRSGEFEYLMFVSKGKYKGFWGENGFDNMLILGFDWNDQKWYKIADAQTDIFDIYNSCGCFKVDIESEFGIPRIYFPSKNFKINYDGISSCVAELVNQKGE